MLPTVGPDETVQLVSFGICWGTQKWLRFKAAFIHTNAQSQSTSLARLLFFSQQFRNAQESGKGSPPWRIGDYEACVNKMPLGHSPATCRVGHRPAIHAGTRYCSQSMLSLNQLHAPSDACAQADLTLDVACQWQQVKLALMASSNGSLCKSAVSKKVTFDGPNISERRDRCSSLLLRCKKEALKQRSQRFSRENKTFLKARQGMAIPCGVPEE